jgi:isopenicillin-N N-acyltransferase like protein
MIHSCPFIEIAGRPYERGLAYGSQAKAYVKRGVRHYSQQLQSLAMDWATVQRIVRDYLRRTEEYGPQYVEEMRGIADGAGLTLDEIMLLNARTEVIELALHPERLRGLRIPGIADGCTAVVALPEATAAGRLIHAHNWDWKVGAAEASLVVRVRRSDGPDFITFTEAGALARFGFNSVGIGVTANYLESDRDYRQVGVPLAIIRRKVLEEEHFALAVKTVYTTPKSGSNNIILSDARGLVIAFECAPDETFLLEPERGLLVHTNHWLSPIALAKLRDTGIEATPCSIPRNIRARQLLQPQIDRLTPEAIRAALFDDFGTPWAICRPPPALAPEGDWATVAMLIMEPASGRLDVTMMPAVNRQSSTFVLEMERDAAAA